MMPLLSGERYQRRQCSLRRSRIPGGPRKRWSSRGSYARRSVEPLAVHHPDQHIRKL